MVCRRLQIISCRAPGAERGSDPPSKISSYDPLMGTSKAAIGAVGKRTFFVQKQNLSNALHIGILRALLTNLWQ
jgi:hypothetical protein